MLPSSSGGAGAAVFAASALMRIRLGKIISIRYLPGMNFLETIIDASYVSKTIDLEGTRFHLHVRVSGLFSLEQFESTLRRVWGLFYELPRPAVREAWVLDVEAPIGGGPLGKFAIGVYSSQSIPREFLPIITQSLGWEPQNSTLDYIQNQYASFADPEQAYLEDMLIHELGHLFFGFGLTDESSKPLHEAWFSFGMGMLYDRLAWSRLHQKTSPLFETLIRMYSERFSKIVEIDQRLIEPDTSRDSEFGLQRVQVYAHGKAYLFLLALREAVGVDRFDENVGNYLVHKDSPIFGYDTFTQRFDLRTQIYLREIEGRFQIR